MGRSILAVVVSYIVMMVLVFGSFMSLWIGLGPNKLLEPGTFQGNMFLCIAAPSIAGLAGVLGGWLCGRMARGKMSAVVGLAVLTLVAGLTMGYFTMQKPFPTGARDPNMTMEELMKVGREPDWVAIGNPIIGAVGVMIGGLVLGRRKAGERK